MKCFVVEDHAPFRREIVSQLAVLPGVVVVGYATTLTEAVRGIADASPDLLTLDLSLARGSGLDVLAAVRVAHPGLIILILTNHAHPIYRARCLVAGAHYFFDKSTEFAEAIDACARMSHARMPQPAAAGDA